MGTNLETMQDTDRISEYEGLAIKEIMGRLDDDVVIKIGSVDGSGFVFGGSVEQYKDECVELDDMLHDKCVKSVKWAKASVKNALNDPHISVADYLREIFESVDKDYARVKPTMDGYMAFFERRIHALARRADRVAEAEKRLREYQPTGERKVVYAYKATTQFDPPNTLILIAEGGESGKAWTVEDYRDALVDMKPDKSVIPFDSEEYDEVFSNDK